MRLRDASLALLLLAVPAASLPPVPAALPMQAGDAIPAVALQRALVQRTYAYFAAKDKGDFNTAYALLAPSMKQYLKPDLYRQTSERFNREAGPVEARRVVKLTWERDPAEAPEPGLYVAADFVGVFPNIELMCGYVMWKQQADGSFRIVREEQNLIDKATANAMVPERRRTLPRLFGCVGA